MDHINRHDKIAQRIVRAGFVVAIVHHRPVAMSPAGCAALFGICSFFVATLLALPLSLPLLPILVLACLTMSACFAIAIELCNMCRGAVSFAEVIDDVARGIATVHHDPRLSGRRTTNCLGDANKLVLVGNSSGGHLLSLLALDHRWLDALGVSPRAIKAVVDVSGVPTLCSPLWPPFRWLLLVCLLGFDNTAASQLSPLVHAAAHTRRRAAMRAACATSDDAAGHAAMVPPLAPFWYLLVAQYELPSLRALSRAFGAELERGAAM